MTGYNLPGTPALLSTSKSPTRRLPYSLELLKSGRTWVCVNTARANRVVEEALTQGQVDEFPGELTIHPEVSRGSHRFDFLLEARGGERCLVEVKNVTLARGRVALFPDAVTTRGASQVRELGERAEAGERAVLFYLVCRGDCRSLAVAADIDPHYAAAVKTARAQGLETMAYRAACSARGIQLQRALPQRIG